MDKAEIEKALEKVLPRQFTKESIEKIIGPVYFALDVDAINKSINDPMWDLLDRGGKRWRPILFLTVVELLNKTPNDFLELAVVFELIHNATLIHDDIEDDSDTRRGKATLHKIYGVDIAVNVGDALYFLPLKILDKYSDKLSKEQISQIQKTYIDEMVKLSIGQATDIAWHKGLVDGFSITEEEYLQMCAFKTGGLARMTCVVAAIVGGADERLIHSLGELGERLGVIFQIKDDILNITKNKLSEGKGLGEDITEGKISLPVIYARHNLLENKSKRLGEILLMHTKDKQLILEAISLIEEGEGIEKAEVAMEKLFKATWERLDPLLTDGENKAKLFELAHFLIERSI